MYQHLVLWEITSHLRVTQSVRAVLYQPEVARSTPTRQLALRTFCWQPVARIASSTWQVAWRCQHPAYHRTPVMHHTAHGRLLQSPA
jgi:hypothetical protein